MNRVTKRALLLSIGLGLGSLGFGLSAAAPANAADKVTWTWSLYGPPRAATVTFEYLAKVAIETPVCIPLRALETLPARCRRMSPVVNISPWIP